MSIKQLKLLYEQMAEHTQPECAKCRVPFSCCSPEYCDMATATAERHGVKLRPTGHPTLLYMGPSGCTVEPYLRPLCTVHTCAINSFGFKPNDTKWTKKYFRLRDRIEELEWQVEEEKDHATEDQQG
jgi:hypothetical protein